MISGMQMMLEVLNILSCSVEGCKISAAWIHKLQQINNVVFYECQKSSRKHAYITDPFKPHFYIVKLGFTGVYIIFLISTLKYRLWVLVRTASPISVLSRNKKIIRVFVSENFQFLKVKFSIYFNRRVFLMIHWVDNFKSWDNNKCTNRCCTHVSAGWHYTCSVKPHC